MYTSFFGLQEKPFAITPDPRYLYLSGRHAEALAHLLYGINESGGFIQLTGEVGTGKTTVIRSLLEQLPGACGRGPDPESAHYACGVPADDLRGTAHPGAGAGTRQHQDADGPAGRHLLDTHARGRRVVLIVDEAQNLSTETLEQVRLLTNLETATTKLLQIILIGQPELRDLLDRAELRQLAQRITGRYHLDPLSREESAGYVRHRMRVAGATAEVFTPSALREIQRLSHGVPRVINVVCDRALLGGFTREEHRVGAALIRQAASEVYGRPIPAPWLKWATAAATVAAVGLVAVGLVSLWSGKQDSPAPATADTPRSAPATAIPTATASDTPAAVSPAAVEAVQFDDLLATHAGDTTTEAALTRLFATWGATYDPSRGTGCEQAAGQGLECLFQKGSWAQLRTLDRPAILTLTDQAGRTHQVVLVGLTDEAATFDIGETVSTVPIAEASRYWFGDFLLLWRPPLAVPKALGPGSRGEDVRWLRESLRAAQGLPAAPGSDVYDADLTNQVQDFQRQHRLAVDGIAGVQTQIVLDTAIRATGSPTIVSTPAGS